MNELVAAAAQVGFPIVVALLLIVRVENKMEKFGDKVEKFGEKVDLNTSATNRLTTIIEERLVRGRRL